MRTETPHAIYLKDYTPPAWLIDTVDLHVAIHEGYAEVRATLACRRNPQGAGGALVLNGEAIALRAVGLDGTALAPSRYTLADSTLTIVGVDSEPLPNAFMLETVVRIEPDRNTRLSGLYRSRDGYFTQCEAEGFRHITFFPDRPDVMARFTCSIEADRERFPQLLSNGNLVEQGDLDNGRHFAKWHDPFPKPSYLFALVAADLVAREQHIRTRSGKDHLLQVWVRRGDLDKTEHAMNSLIASVVWDEARFRLPLDLDRFMIVAVGDFNMGAMENKGLNIFNTDCVLASPSVAAFRSCYATAIWSPAAGARVMGAATGRAGMTPSPSRPTCLRWSPPSLRFSRTAWSPAPVVQSDSRSTSSRASSTSAPTPWQH